MSEIYSAQHRALQQEFDTQSMADRVRDVIVLPEIAEDHKGFIESRDFFFLTTIDHRGFPTCSYKGGNTGIVRAVDGKTLVFPSYDGNGMYLSMGNISANPKIGMLFIDFETPHRVRVHGTATVSRNDPMLACYKEAELLVRVNIEEIFVNCPRYIHRYARVDSSRYVPKTECETPMAGWKHIDIVQDVISDEEKKKAQEAGIIPAGEWMEKVKTGDPTA